MLHKTVSVSTLTSLILVLSCPLISAQTMAIPHTARGSYMTYGSHLTEGYFVGRQHFDSFDFRNYFVFDLSGITQPIASAELALFLRSAPAGFSSGQSSEDYELHDVTSAVSGLLTGSTGSTGIAAYNDLGNGVVYGSRTVTADNMGTMVEITLNPSAIAALDAATGLIGIGGSLTTLTTNSLSAEHVFGFSYLGGATELRLTLVPEPSTLLLLGIGAISLLGYRKAKSHF